MTLVEFEQQVFAVAMASSICDIPIVRRLTPTSINLRLNVTTGGFIDLFYPDCVSVEPKLACGHEKSH